MDCLELFKCCTCGEQKTADSFHKNKNLKTGLTPTCKVCRKEESKRHRAKYRDKLILQSKEYREKFPDLASQAKKNSYLKKREIYNNKGKIYYQNNKEKIKIANKKWQEENKDKLNIIKKRYKFRKRNAVGNFTNQQLIDRVLYYGEKCWLCGRDWEHIDHVKPLSKNGSNWPANLRPSCGSCNQKKGSTWYGPDTIDNYRKKFNINNKRRKKNGF